MVWTRLQKLIERVEMQTTIMNKQSGCIRTINGSVKVLERELAALKEAMTDEQMSNDLEVGSTDQNIKHL